MKKVFAGFCVLSFVFTGVLLCLSGCGQQSADATSEKPALVINGLHLTPSELRQELETSSLTPHSVADPEVDENAEPEWISRIIEREVLVQEAQRLGLDRQPEFLRTIERFWKEALIKSLLNHKGKEIENEVHIYDREIEDYYGRLVASQGAESVGPLEDLREELRRTVRQKKQTETMDAWISKLKEEAKISIDHEAVSQLAKE